MSRSLSTLSQGQHNINDRSSVRGDSRLLQLLDTSPEDEPVPTTLAEALVRMTEAEDTLRAIAAGEVDAFVVSDGGQIRRVFTLSTADRTYRMFVENMHEGAATLSSNGLILYANRRLAGILARTRETIVGSPLSTHLLQADPQGLRDILGADGLGTNLELDLVDSSGVTVPVLVGSSPLEIDGDRLTCLTFTDLRGQKAQDREIVRLSQAQAERMADLQEAQAALTKQATHDALTGLPNRALLIHRIDQALIQARSSDRSVAVFFVDLDRFKQINDTYGHAAGDTVLRRVAEQLCGQLRPVDTVARIGGDEFVVLTPAVESHVQAMEIGNRLVAELCRRPDRAADGERVSASVGIATSVSGRGTAEEILNEADTAMYHAKSLGGARAEAFDAGLGRQVLERAVAESMVQSALDDSRIVAYYQPIIGLADGTVAGYEALVRIRDVDGTILAPAAFISVAEDTGLIIPLGTNVLMTGCQEASQWSQTRAVARGLTLAVNLSARQFQPGNLVQIVRDTLRTNCLDAERLHLELTETAIIDLRPDILNQLGLLRDLGVEIGLDDFGTGYASLTHIRRLPLSFVKIDQTFVQGIGEDQSDERIVAAVVDLAANLGLRSIAEGVETEDQLSRLRELGCDQAQGYLFARPMPAGAGITACTNSVW